MKKVQNFILYHSFPYLLIGKLVTYKKAKRLRVFRCGTYRARQGHPKAGGGDLTVRVRGELLFNWRENRQ